MKKILLSSAFLAVLSLTLVSCNKQETIDQKARWFVSARGGYACDLLSDSIDVYALFPEKYFDTDPDDYYEPLCAHNERQYLIYEGTSEIARRYADSYNALVMLHNINSDSQTSARFGEDDESVYKLIADSMQRLDCSIIRNDTLRQYILQARDNVAYYVRSAHKKGEGKVEKAFDQAFSFVAEHVNPVIENTGEAYKACVARTEYFQSFDSVRAKRGTSDKTYQQELLNHLYLAETPAERHVYAIEFAHSDSTNAYFLIGAAVLNREFVDNAQYSPYLSEMWLTWRASLSTLIGASSWSYIPNLIYNQKRAQVAQIIIRHIENNPSDILAQGILIDLAGNNNISRFGGLFGNSAIVEQMSMFPEWEEKHHIK